jgi:MOSC domain-containing protein YiiM
MGSGRVEEIYIANGAPGSGERQPVDAARAVAGEGLEGDRYAQARGIERAPQDGRDLTLIEAEAVEGLASDTGIELDPAEHGRNVVTRGIGLNDLVGRRFLIGEVECYGDRPDDPCAHLERRTEPGVLRGLVNRGGLRSNIVRGGEIRVGDEVRALD